LEVKECEAINGTRMPPLQSVSTMRPGATVRVGPLGNPRYVKCVEHVMPTGAGWHRPYAERATSTSIGVPPLLSSALLASGREKEFRAVTFTSRVLSCKLIMRRSGGCSTTRQSGQPRIIPSRALWDGQARRAGGPLSQRQPNTLRKGSAMRWKKPSAVKCAMIFHMKTCWPVSGGAAIEYPRPGCLRGIKTSQLRDRTGTARRSAIGSPE
jgi:hypothetical protein